MSTEGNDDNEKLRLKLLTLYDEFTEFNASCAFFCDAVAALGAGEDEWLDQTSAEGLAFQSQWLKERSAALKTELGAVWHAAKGEG